MCCTVERDLGTAGKTTTLDAESLETTESAKQKIEDENGIPAGQQRLIFAGHQLEEGQPISYYKTVSESTLNLVRRLRGGMYHVP